MQATETIAAIATAPGAGGIGVVRLSGPRAIAIATLLTGTDLQPRHAHYVAFHDGDGARIDDGIALGFPAPHSYTGEDVVELQGHGSPILLQQVLRRCLALGARMARPGEFTERAYLNQKIDLVQAEAVADLIAAGSDLAVRAARRSLEGVFSQRVNGLLAVLTALRVHVEAAIDFPEEEIDFLADVDLLRRLDAVQSEHATLLTEATRGQRLRDGLHVVILGAPNVGKSSLLNALAGSDRAIVTAIPGTTRDVLRESVQVEGIDITLVDTAGLRETGDVVELEGMRRARAELAGSDLVLAVVDARNPGGEENALQSILTEELAGKPTRILWLHNKADLLDFNALPGEQAGHVWISARSGMHLDNLRLRLRDAAGVGEGADGAFTARARHVEALCRVGTHLQTSRERLLIEKAGELAAEELRLAQSVLGEITGATDSDDLLGAIFASFCIGK